MLGTPFCDGFDGLGGDGLEAAGACGIGLSFVRGDCSSRARDQAQLRSKRGYERQRRG